jgi:hypothetical protein
MDEIDRLQQELQQILLDHVEMCRPAARQEDV